MKMGENGHFITGKLLYFLFHGGSSTSTLVSWPLRSFVRVAIPFSCSISQDWSCAEVLINSSYRSPPLIYYIDVSGAVSGWSGNLSQSMARVDLQTQGPLKLAHTILLLLSSWSWLKLLSLNSVNPWNAVNRYKKQSYILFGSIWSILMTVFCIPSTLLRLNQPIGKADIGIVVYQSSILVCRFIKYIFQLFNINYLFDVQCTASSDKSFSNFNINRSQSQVFSISKRHDFFKQQSNGTS